MKEYCEHCKKKTDYVLKKNVDLQEYVRGELIDYVGVRSFCSVCGNEVVTPEMEEKNLYAVLDKFNKTHKPKAAFEEVGMTKEDMDKMYADYYNESYEEMKKEYEYQKWLEELYSEKPFI